MEICWSCISCIGHIIFNCNPLEYT
uniref:Uncharacterized protein n=1 Tax=Arundo donax TaxID=35708 RepID=A0A0A8YDM8_ARUDO